MTAPLLVGPDGEISIIDCPTCAGGGVVYENHGGGAVETLGCSDCCHPDLDQLPEGKVWRFYLLPPKATRDNPDRWELRDALDSEWRKQIHSGRDEARYWLRRREQEVAGGACRVAEQAIRPAVLAWRESRLSRDLERAMAADHLLFDAVTALVHAEDCYGSVVEAYGIA